MSEFVRIFEMAPRDGLQNEKMFVKTVAKIHLVDLLSDCGLRNIEVTSFVSPKWVPQLADAAEVMAGIKQRQGVTYSALTPNLRGFQMAKAAGADEVAIFASASETFSQQNINCSIAESLVRFEPVMQAASEASIPVRGYVSCVTDCPYEGAIDSCAVADLVGQLLELGCYQISLGDTIGAGTPQRVAQMLDTVLPGAPAAKLAGHFHDTQGHALANIEVTLANGIRVFDASVGGLGGCPFAPGAKGNVDTCRVVELVEAKGFSTGLDCQKLAAAAEYAVQLRSDSR